MQSESSTFILHPLQAVIPQCITQHPVVSFQQYPIVTVTGPRQSGKMMFCTPTFPGLKYLNREVPDEREFAESAPREFLIHRIPCAPMPRPIVVADAIPNPLVRSLPIFHAPTGTLAKQRVVVSLPSCSNPSRAIVRT